MSPRPVRVDLRTPEIDAPIPMCGAVGEEDRRPPRPPRPVAVAQTLLAVIAVDHIVVPAIALTHLSALRAAVGAAHPSASVAAITRSVDTILATTLGVHGPLLILTVLLVWKLPTGHPWARRPATASQAFGILFSGLSSAPLPALHGLLPVVDAVQLTVILLLWAPRSSREFFGAYPRSRRSRPAEN